MIGETISHYKILEKLGSGGMGNVYKAYDTSLKRNVALKFLPPELTRDEEARKRFIREAQAAAFLDHRNICTVYEVGESEGHTFIAMQLVGGQDLRERIRSGPLPIDEAIEWTLQVGRGLSKAHNAGIIHRDVKPGNVLLTEDGQAKVVDFGLAKLSEQTKLTRTGTTLGTVAYMSPEQARGDEVDHRADVWALGAVLYEMLTGSMPFRGDYEPAVVYSILNEHPEPVTATRREVPVSLEDVVERSLAKDPERRYQSVDEMLSALEMVREESRLGIERRGRATYKRLARRKHLLAGLAAVAVIAIAVVLVTIFFESGQAIDSIAVLPIENISDDPKREYFADDVTRELTSTLGRISGWEVKASRTMMRYRETDKSPGDIAAEVEVKALLDVSIQSTSDGRFEARAELIDGVTEKLLWTQSFECGSSEVNSMLNSIARSTSERIGIELTPSEDAQLASAHPVNPEAHTLYLMGRGHYDKWTVEGFEKAIEYFQKTIEIDPNYARAYALIADSYLFLRYLGALSLNEARTRAEPPLRKAMEIDDKLPEAHYVAAGIKHYLDWDWEGAEAAYKRTIALNPNFADAHYEYAFLLMAMGRSTEAIAEAKRALQLDPLSLPVHWSLIWAYHTARQYDQAVAQWRQAVELWPNNPNVYMNFNSALATMGRYEDAVRARKKAMTLRGVPSERVAALDSAYNESGPEGFWTWCLESRKGRHDSAPVSTAKYYAQLGDRDQAIAWLEKAYENHDGELHLLKVHPWWDPLREDQHFKDLLRRMNFPENESQ